MIIKWLHDFKSTLRENDVTKTSNMSLLQSTLFKSVLRNMTIIKVYLNWLLRFEIHYYKCRFITIRALLFDMG